MDERMTLLERFTALIRRDPTAHEHTITAEMGMPYTDFSRQLRAETGQLPSWHKLRIRMAYAAELLSSDPPMSCRVVAVRVGYSHYTEFMRAYRQVYGVAPSVTSQRARDKRKSHAPRETKLVDVTCSVDEIKHLRGLW